MHQAVYHEKLIVHLTCSATAEDCSLIVILCKPSLLLSLAFTELCVYISGSRQSTGAVDGRKHCLLMDEVDGMAGNEDRGGLQVQN